MNVKIKAIEYHLVDHCNLNCAGCTHFAPIAKKRYAFLEKFEENIIQLKKWNFTIHQFNLLGGEPLLHPRVKDFIVVARKHLNCKLTIKTNGILLTKEFIDFCDTHNCVVVFTDYGNLDEELKKTICGNSDYKEIEKFKYHFISEEKIENTMCGDTSFQNKYYNACSQLEENGDLHFCGYSANVKHYNEFYNKNIPVVKNKDYFNIYDTSLTTTDIWKILRFKRPFCDYCTLPITKEWHRYNGENEWKR